jgi:hypothetical protein
LDCSVADFSRAKSHGRSPFFACPLTSACFFLRGNGKAGMTGSARSAQRSVYICVQQGDIPRVSEEVEEEAFPSAVPFLPPLTDKTLNDYIYFYATAVTLLIVFGGYLAPVAEVKLGLGGGGLLPPPPNTLGPCPGQAYDSLCKSCLFLNPPARKQPGIGT